MVRASSDMRLGSQGGSHTIFTFTSPTPGTLATAFSTMVGNSCAEGQLGVVSVISIVIDVDLVDQAELVDVGRNFRIVHGLERSDDIVGQPRQLALRQRRGWRG